MASKWIKSGIYVNLVVGNCAHKFYYVIVCSCSEVCTWITNTAKLKSFNLRVVSNHWTGLWTGLLDWTDGLDYWT